MSIDEAIEVYTQQTAILEYAIEQGVPKIKMIRLFDQLDKLNGVKADNSIIKQIEKTIASIAEDSFNEQLNAILCEIKKEIKQFKVTK